MIPSLCFMVAALCLLFEAQRQMYAKKLRAKDAEIRHLESSINHSRENKALPDVVWDKDGNEYLRLFGEFGNDEFMKCD